jgi:hypothetical protein
MSEETKIRAVIDKAREEMIFVGPDHPYYALLADLVSAVESAWQQGYAHRCTGGANHNPYSWTVG